MNFINKLLALLTNITAKKRKALLTNTDFSIISNNCVGSLMYRLLNLKYTSPTINVIIDRKYFMDFCYHLKEYCSVDMHELDKNAKKDYDTAAGIINGPKGLKDIVVYFPHDKNSKEAIRKWNYRKQRINYNNLFIVFDTHMYLQEDDFINFDKIPYKNKVIFIENDISLCHPNEFKFSWYTKNKYDNNIIFKNVFKLPYLYTTLDEFDFIHWLNTSKIRINRNFRNRI